MITSQKKFFSWALLSLVIIAIMPLYGSQVDTITVKLNHSMGSWASVSNL